jgi:chromosome segregation ATPase
MLEELLANMTFSPAMIGAIVAAVLTFAIGRASRGFSAQRREDNLKRELLDAKGSVPQLESTVRNRDQQVGRLEAEIKELTDRTSDLLRGQDTKANDLKKAEREVKNLKSELNVVRGHRDDNDNIIMDGFDDEPVANDGDSASLTKLKKVEALYEKMKGALIKRDSQIEELEAKLKGGITPESDDSSPEDDDAVHDATRPLKEKIKSQEQTIETIQSEVSELRQEKEMLEDLASRRSKSNRVLKDTASEIEAKVPTLERDIKARDETIGIREASIKRMLGEAEDAKAEVTKHQAKIETLNTDIESMRASVDTSNDKVAGLQASVNAREERVSNLETELAATLKVVEGQQQQQREAEARLTELQRDADGRLIEQQQQEQTRLAEQQTLKEAHQAEQQTASESFDKRLEEKDRERLSVEGSLKDRDFKISALTDEISTLHNDLQSVRQETEDARQETETARGETLDVRQETQDVRRQVQLAQQETQDALTISEKRQEVVSSEVSDAERVIAIRNRDIDDLQADLRQRDHWLEKIKVTLEERESRSSELQARVVELEADLLGVNEQLRNRKQQHQDVGTERHELEREIVNERARAEQAQAELKEEKQSIVVYKSMIADKEFQLETLQAEVASLTGQPSQDNGSAESSGSVQAIS